MYNFSFSLHSVSVNLVISACSLSLPKCDTALAANCVSLKYLISSCGYLYTQTIPSTGAVGCVSWCYEQLKLCFVAAALI